MCSIGHPNTTVVCIEKYEAKTFGHLSIQPGDVIEVVGSTDCGLLEGFVRGTSNTGLFPSQYVQEVQFRHKNGGGNNNNSNGATTLDRQNNNHAKTIDLTGPPVDLQRDDILKK
jgi:SH3/ankyrin repeat-containing protein